MELADVFMYTVQVIAGSIIGGVMSFLLICLIDKLRD